MDWYAWLCRAGLHPDVALDYALLFARNDLGADDVRHLDHDFLATMGVAVAKHRLEILKLARKESSSRHAAAAITALPWHATRLLAAAVHRSARSALGRLRASVSCSSRRPPRGLDRRRSRAGGGAANPLATPRRLPLHRGGGKAAHGWGKIAAASPVAIRAGKLMALAHVGTPVLLTNSRADKWWSNNGATVKALPAPAGFLAGTEACSCDVEDDGDDPDDGAGEEEMRWESMFEDLKPT